MSLVNGGDSTLFKEILSSVKNVDPSESEAEIFSLGMAMVLSLRDKSTLERALSTIVDIIHQIAADTGEEESEVIVPVLLDKAGPCLKEVIATVFSEKKGSVALAKVVLGLPSSAVRKGLLDELNAHCDKTKELKEILGAQRVEETDSGVEDDAENVMPTQNTTTCITD